MDKMRILITKKQNWNYLTISIVIFYGLMAGLTSSINGALVHKIEVMVNDIAFIHCYMDASIDIQWHFNSISKYVYAGRRLRDPYSERFRTQYDNGTYILIIPRVRSEDAGWYYCSEEISGRRISSTHLTVLYSNPVCSSNMHPDGFIGPNACNIEAENMVFNCAVSFNGTSPHLMWRSLNDNRTLNSSNCEDQPNRRKCSLMIKSDPVYDGSTFICQTTASTDLSFNCSIEGIKILYFYANRSVTQKKVNENINCAVRSNINFKYTWKFEQDNKYTSLSANHTLFIKDPGIYQCEVKYNIRNVSCIFLVSAVAAVDEGGTLLGLILPIVLPLVGLILIFACLILYQQRRERKQKRNRKYETLEFSSLLKSLENENKDLMSTREDDKKEITRLKDIIEGIPKNEIIKDKVISIYKDFVSEVDPKNVFGHLIKNGIVRPEEKQTVMNEDTAKERCRALIDHLFCCSNENAFIILREALREPYPKIIERLEAVDLDDENEDDYSTSKLENEKIRNKIFGMESDFVSDVDPVNVFDLLIQSKIVNIKQKQFILKKSFKKEERCRALLDHLTFSSKEKAFIILKDALKEHYHGIVERIDTFNEDTEIEFSTRFESCTIVVGSMNRNGTGQDVLKIKLNGTKEIYNIQPLPPQMMNESAAAVYDNSLFVAGIEKTCDKIWKFDARSSSWEYCNTMIRGRGGHSVAFVDHVLYICGGWVHNGEIELYEVEAYDTIDDRCTTVGKLALAFHNSGNCVPFKSSLYIFGGIDVNHSDVDCVQVYDTKFNSCAFLPKRMPVAGRHLRAVLWENKAILLGKNNCLVYNFETGTWPKSDHQFKTDIHYFGMIVHNGKLFVIGGGDETGEDGWFYRDDVRSVPVANVLNNESIEWLHHAKLPKPSTVYCVGIMGFRIQ